MDTFTVCVRKHTNIKGNVLYKKCMQTYDIVTDMRINKPLTFNN